MRVIQPSYEIQTPISEGGIEELKFIEKIGRTCYKSEDRITEDGESAKRFIKMLLSRGHESVLEHSKLTVKFTIDRGISHEIVRHRLASYTQESTRYVNYAKDKFGNEINVIDIENSIKYDNKMSVLSAEQIQEVLKVWGLALEASELYYMKMIELGATPQIARSVLPNSTKTELIVTANLREWRHILNLRTDSPAHPQMREIMILLLKELQSRIPIIFDDIGVE